MSMPDDATTSEPPEAPEPVNAHVVSPIGKQTRHLIGVLSMNGQPYTLEVTLCMGHVRFKSPSGDEFDADLGALQEIIDVGVDFRDTIIEQLSGQRLELDYLQPTRRQKILTPCQNCYGEATEISLHLSPRTVGMHVPTANASWTKAQLLLHIAALCTMAMQLPDGLPYDQQQLVTQRPSETPT